MRTGTKVKGFMLLAVVAATWLWLFNPTQGERGNPGDDRSEVSLKVWWEPVRRHQPVRIMYRLSGATQYNGELNESPWFETFFTPRGTVVTLIAIQLPDFDPGTLHCSLTANQVVSTEGATLKDNGTNSCIVMGIA